MKEESSEFQVSADEMEHLIQLVSHDEPLAALLRCRTSASTGKVVIRLSRAEAERVRDCLTTQLAKVGFDQNYSPNDLGRMLEALIDRFYVS